MPIPTEPSDCVAETVLEKWRNFIEQYPAQTPQENYMKECILEKYDKLLEAEHIK